MDGIFRFKGSLINEEKMGLALDIDETLSWTVKHWFEEMSLIFGNPENLTAVELVTKYRYAKNVPYWQTEQASIWRKNAIESNELQEKLPLIENSNHIVQKINSIIPVVAYITVRPQSVIDGTKKWLKKHGFPSAEIIARPAEVAHEDGNKWKAEVLQILYPNITGIIDDNPSLIDHLSDNYRGTIFLYNMETLDEKKEFKVVPCENWVDVLKEVKRIYLK